MTGLYNKYFVKRVDNKDLPGNKHENCQYFVLDVTHDLHALPALLAYANSCNQQHPELSKDLKKLVKKHRSKND